jgi:probable F420-dependent oxidoreductase
MEGRWGLTIPMPGVPLPEHQRLVGIAAESGYTDLWSSEASGTDAFTPLALAAAWAPSLRLGTAIVPVATRGPGLLAMCAAALAEAAPGRFALGVGASAPAIVTAWNARPYTKPFEQTRDTVRFLRRALAGEVVDEAYETFTVRRFRLERPPPVPPPLLIAALRPRMLRLAAAEADGVVLNWLAATDLPQVLSTLGDVKPGFEIAARLFVCPTADAALARTIGRRLIAGYLTVPAYEAFHRWLGRDTVLGPMWTAWAAGDRAGALAAIPDEVVDGLVLHGTPAEIRAALAAYVAGGVNTPVLAILPVPGTQSASAIAALGPSAGAAEQSPRSSGRIQATGPSTEERPRWS